MNILAIETSCDETAAAVVQNGTKIISNVVASSKHMHEKYGGIVPEVAAREQIQSIIPVLSEALAPLKNSKNQSNNQVITNSIDSIAVTIGPGLIGSLLVGIECAKTIAFLSGKPLIPVNHVLAHMYANFVEKQVPSQQVHPSQRARSVQNGKADLKSISASTNTNRQSTTDNQRLIQFPAVSLVVSGGHTELYVMNSHTHIRWLGGTIDDAAGEAFDKIARLIGLGHGGGAAIETSAKKAMKKQFDSIKLPRPMIQNDSCNFSFSGLKTAALREWGKKTHSRKMQQLLAHETQEAITDVLVQKTMRAAAAHNAQSILISGGVSSNQRLREKFNTTIRQSNNPTMVFFAPEKKLCTDNAVYIASYACYRGKKTTYQQITAIPNLSVETKR